MPQLNSLVLNDRETTPVAHTFTPRDITDGVGALVESSGVPIGDSRFTLGIKKLASGRYKATIKGVFPVIQNQTINGITSPVVVRTAYCDMAFTFDETSSLQERKNVVGMMQSSLDANKALVNDVLTKLEGIY